MQTSRIIYLTLFCLYMAALAFLCFAKPEDVPQLPELWFGLPADKVGHFIMFAPFPVLGYMAFCRKDMSLGGQFMLILGLITAGATLAIGTEQVQALLQYRSAEINDLVADAAGISCGTAAVIVYIILKRKA